MDIIICEKCQEENAFGSAVCKKCGYELYYNDGIQNTYVNGLERKINNDTACKNQIQNIFKDFKF